MNRIILLTCLGICVGQTPANTHLSMLGSPYMSDDLGREGAHSYEQAQDGNHDVLREPLNEVRNNSTQTDQDTNVGTAGTGIDRNELRTVYQQSVVPQSRSLASARFGVPPSMYIPKPTPFSLYNDNARVVAYNFDILSPQNGGNPLLVSNSRSDSHPRLNPHYSGPSLFSQSAQAAAAEVRSSPSRPSISLPQYQLSAYLSNQQTSPTAAAYSRSSFDGYYSSDESRTSRPSNPNEYIQQTTQGNLDSSNNQFSYDVNAVEGGRSVQFAHEETRSLDQAAGAYSVLLPDGQRQIVEYTADQNGYRPRVSYADAGRQQSDGNVETEIYANYEPSVIAARSYLNGQANTVQNRYLHQDPRTRSHTHLYN